MDAIDITWRHIEEHGYDENELPVLIIVRYYIYTASMEGRRLQLPTQWIDHFVEDLNRNTCKYSQGLQSCSKRWRSIVYGWLGPRTLVDRAAQAPISSKAAMSFPLAFRVCARLAMLISV